MNVDCSIVIVSWNVRELLRRCLASLPQACGRLRCEVVVVDNDSADDSAEMIRAAFHSVDLIASPANLGFARANNLAYERTSGEFILFLNPDTEPRPESIERLVATARRDAKTGIVGPMLQNPDGSRQPSIRRFPSLLAMTLIFFKLQYLFPNASPLRRYLCADLDPTRATAVDQVMGACLLVRRSMLEAIGRFDPGYYLWFEEVDLCRRARDGGWTVRYDPTSLVVHAGGQSFGQLASVSRAWRFSRSCRRYFRKHHGIAAATFIDFLTPFAVALSALAGWTKFNRV